MVKAYKFRVLIDTKEEQEIFRDIVVPQNESFELFFKAIMAAFEFRGDQLASFYMSNDNWDRGYEISLMDMNVEETEGEQPSLMNNTILKDLIKEDNQKMILVYDFLKMWCFLVELRESPDIEDEEQLPAVAMEMGKPPHEDERDIGIEDDINPEDFDTSSDDSASGSEEDDENFENIDDLDI